MAFLCNPWGFAAESCFCYWSVCMRRELGFWGSEKMDFGLFATSALSLVFGSGLYLWYEPLLSVCPFLLGSVLLGTFGIQIFFIFRFLFSVSIVVWDFRVEIMVPLTVVICIFFFFGRNRVMSCYCVWFGVWVVH